MVDIIQGSDKTIQLSFIQNGAAYNLTGLTAMSVFFPSVTPIEKTLGAGVTVSSSSGGLVQVVLSNDDTAALTLGLGLALEIIADFGSTKKIFQLNNTINVAAKLYA